MKNIKKKYLIILLVIVEVITLSLTFKFLNSKKYELDDVNKIIVKKPDMYAMYIQESNGDYSIVNNVSSFPDLHTYKLNLDESTCFDNNGLELESILDFKNNEVSVETSKTVFCYLFFDLRTIYKYSVSVDVNNLQTLSNYTKSVTSSDGTARWDSKYNRVIISEIEKNSSEFSLTYAADQNNYTLLKTIAETPGTSGDGIIKREILYYPDYTNAEAVTDFEKIYFTINNSSVEVTDMSQFSVSGLNYNSSTGTFTTNPSALPISDGSVYNTLELVAVLEESEFYEICVSWTGDVRRISVNGVYISQSGCFDHYYLSDNNSLYGNKQRYVTIEYITTPPQVSITIKKSNSYTQDVVFDGGFRYEGNNPNNYVWFNNELWRIIGSVPVCLTANCGDSSTRLVKIVRNSPIPILYTVSSYYYGYHREYRDNNVEWPLTNVYYLLNDYYYGKKDATNGIYCVSYSGVYGGGLGKSNCNYTNIGISDNSDDYYGSMVKNVYWNIGNISNYHSLKNIYESEKSVQLANFKIGLMNVSDTIFAFNTPEKYVINGNYHYDTYCLSYKSNWLLGLQYVMTFFDRISCEDEGSINTRNAIVYPSLYLDSSVYVVSGNGSESNPYQIIKRQ